MDTLSSQPPLIFPSPFFKIELSPILIPTTERNTKLFPNNRLITLHGL